ncbi:MAG: indole-3-glycerol phosphate synthase TrpC [Armatimonadota bacterium]|nr:MAG: indole-3-glycerol phosphate synthase TrpC [Armatimonadota bacterium]
MSVLDEILADKRREVAERKAALPHPGARSSPARDFTSALRGEGVAIIAEFKRASPSRGVIADRPSPAQAAAAYEVGGAAAMSVLTDTKYFDGSLADLQQARGACSLPILRKDFLVDEWQLQESAAAGADAVLLICAALGDDLTPMLGTARDLGLAALVETHNAVEVARAVAVGAGIIGINNRDLTTFQVDLATTRELRPLVPADRIGVSESGISTADDVRALSALGVNAVLVGEALMVAEDSGAMTRELVEAGRHKALSP